MASLTSSRPSQEPLLGFPFLKPDEFDYGCRVLCDRFHAWQISSLGTGLSIQFVHQQTSDSMLKISRHIENIGVHDEENALMHEPEDLQEPQLEDDSEHDPEALIRATEPNASLQVDYDIALSPTYQVPVLYFTLRWTNHKGPVLGIDAVYQYLVPDEYRKQLKSVGIIGGISFDYHPITGAPMFFVHPCNTADAMRHIAGGQDVTPETYLVIWLGLVGHCVGLHMPSELFATEAGARTPERLGQQ
ncbi:ATG3/ATG10 family protein [Aspergillus glaucus CBS 516.65]|uniref:Ubiquitin-like-conjugating enzyme ATG10 n=1 Tax=Aspergillus glaucus CBS 516.65 TaxID=1160497 RepID=A0A1L9VTK3_ASPGL|nr:hypothetical protein ASPGLDRAFT_1147052 [Aspergillus glaucus CBS 516.65]OJJ87239.1 hypothetical protein ASPGLDRAFT_1147052 [Aspergillus glaucus CBS 516.65]